MLIIGYNPNPSICALLVEYMTVFCFPKTLDENKLKKTRVNIWEHVLAFFYDAIFDAILEFSSKSYSSAYMRGKRAILVSTHMFQWVRNTMQPFPTSII